MFHVNQNGDFENDLMAIKMVSALMIMMTLKMKIMTMNDDYDNE
jgi:hypothetical protein